VEKKQHRESVDEIDETHQMAAHYPVSTLGAGALRAGFIESLWAGRLTWIDRGTHLNDGDFFQRLFWLFLEIIVECDWLGREDVDERLDKCVLCLT
jgi:hypothetical protein